MQARGNIRFLAAANKLKWHGFLYNVKSPDPVKTQLLQLNYMCFKKTHRLLLDARRSSYYQTDTNPTLVLDQNIYTIIANKMKDT